MAIRSTFPRTVAAVTAPAGRLVARTGVSPNQLTTLGLALTVAAAGLIVTGRYVAAGVALFVGGAMDALDGAVARATRRATPFGSFYDSVADRISDGLLLGGLAWALRDQPRLLPLALIALVAAEVTSYVRARAEAIDLDCSVGVLERAERALLLIVGLLWWGTMLEPVLWLLVIGGVVTVVQRVHHVWCQIDRDVPEELVALVLRDSAWSRPFLIAARRFYGERNFDGAVDPEARPTRPSGPSG